MIRSLNTAARAMQMEQVRIDALANNLANVSASGYRQIITRLAEPEPTAPAAGGPAPADAAAAAGRATAGAASDARWRAGHARRPVACPGRPARPDPALRP